MPIHEGGRGVAAVVFVHGFLGFDRVGCSPFAIEYFRRVREVLAHGPAVPHFPALPAAGSVAERAEALARYLANQRAERFVLVAHSMGGLDGRRAVALGDPDHRVVRLVTLGTPHRGTPLADWALETDGALQGWARRRWTPALRDLTPDVCQRRNEALTDREDVDYVSVAGSRTLPELPAWLRRFGAVVAARAGDNDGLVPVSSTRWGDFRGTVRSDHFELVGWSLAWPNRTARRPFRHLGLFRQLVDEASASPASPRASGTAVSNLATRRPP